MIDDHDAVKAEFDAIVRDLAAEQVSRATANNVTPPATADGHVAGDGSFAHGCTSALVVTIAVGILAWVLVASVPPAEHPAPSTHGVPAPCSGPSSPCSAY